MNFDWGLYMDIDTLDYEDYIYEDFTNNYLHNDYPVANRLILETISTKDMGKGYASDLKAYEDEAKKAMSLLEDLLNAIDSADTEIERFLKSQLDNDTSWIKYSNSKSFESDWDLASADYYNSLLEDELYSSIFFAMEKNNERWSRYSRLSFLLKNYMSDIDNIIKDYKEFINNIKYKIVEFAFK